MKTARVLIRAKGRGLCVERGLYDCFQKELFTDVSLNYEGGKVRANKGVLAAASPVLSQLLKEWPVVEDPCIIMAGYTAEEVQGLVRYIYTGQVSAPTSEGSSWKKIIDDFKVGAQPEEESDCLDERNTKEQPLVDNGVSEKLRQPETSPRERSSKPLPKRMKPVGPKIVAVTSPRPLIVKVQSLIPGQSTKCEDPLANPEMPSDFQDMAIDDMTNGDPLTKGSKLQKKNRKTLKHLARSGQLTDVRAVALKKLTEKRARASPARLTKKKFVCPFCQRRFLTRGNIKNHIRIHTRDKPFHCPLCKDIFTYLGVYQRHLMKHRENNDITEEEFGSLLDGAMQSAVEHTSSFDENSIRIDETEQLGALSPGEAGDEVVDSAVQQESTSVPEEPDNGNDSTIDNLVADEEMIIASKLAKAVNENKDKNAVEVSSGQEETSVENAASEIAEGDREKTVELPPETTDGAATSKAEEDQNKAVEGDSTSQAMQCDLCPSKFDKWSSLYIHRCTHTGEEPAIQCSVCNEHFNSIEAVKEHKKKHDQDQPLQCERCEKQFISKRALMAHMLVHTYRLTVQCRYCPKILRSMRERHAHERKHTNRSTKLKEALESANATQPPDDAEAMQDTEAKEAKESEEVSQATESTVSESQVDQP